MANVECFWSKKMGRDIDWRLDEEALSNSEPKIIHRNHAYGNNRIFDRRGKSAGR